MQSVRINLLNAPGLTTNLPCLHRLRKSWQPVHQPLLGYSVTGYALFWGALLIDQFPCFLGAPNCD